MLVGWWRMDGDARDYSGFGNHGSASGVAWADGKIGQAGSFNGSNSRIDVEGIRTPMTWGQGFSYCAWVYIPASAEWSNGYNSNIMMRGSYIGSHGLCKTTTNNRVSAYIRGDNGIVTAAGNISRDRWHHLAMTWTGTNLRLYIDGSLESETSVAERTGAPGNTPLYIGRARAFGGNTGSWFDGLIDDVRVYDHALSAKEVKELARAKVLHYKFDDFQEPTENLSPWDGSFRSSSGEHVGNPDLPNGNSTSLGGGWRAATHYNNGICRVEEGGVFGGKKIVWIHRDITGWKGVTPSPSWTARAGRTYTVSVWVRVNSGASGNPSAYGFYGPEGYRWYVAWEKSPKDHPGEWIRGTLTFTPDADVSGIPYLYGISSGHEGLIVEYSGFQIEEKPHATLFTMGARTGAVSDASGYDNHAELSLATTPRWASDAKIGSGAYEMPAGKTLSNIIAQDVIQVSGQLTLAAWIRPTAFPVDVNTIVQGINPSSYYISLGSNGALRSYWYETNPEGYHSTAAGSVPLNKWSHVVSTWDGEYNRLYVNGVLLKTTPVSGEGRRSAGINIGAESAARQFTGIIDDVRIYATALSDEDIKEIYQQRVSLDSLGSLHVQEIKESGATPLIIDYTKWKVGATSAPGFDRNGAAAENLIIEGADPWGAKTAIWEAVPDGSNNADGGWNTSRFPVDNNKTYRFSVWVNRTVMGDNGIFYLGCNGYGSTDGVAYGAGTVSTNPYFYHGRGLPEGEWVLVVGHVHPHHYSGPEISQESGIYRMNGQKYGNITRDFRWLPETSQARHRSYLYYTTDTRVRQRWCYPRVDVIDGSEPTINDLLSGRPDTHASNPPIRLQEKRMEASKLSEVAVTNGLIAWLPLDGHARDISGNQNDGTVSGATPTPAFNGKMGYEFDGLEDRIVVADMQSVLKGNNYSWSAWINRSSSNNSYNMFMGQSLPYFGLRSGGDFIFSASISGTQRSVYSSASYTDNSWYHFVATYDGEYMRVYINNILDGQSHRPGEMSPGSSNHQFSIGEGRDSHWYPFVGKVADVRIYNRALSPQEVAILYKATKPNPTPMQQTQSGIYLAGQLIEV